MDYLISKLLELRSKYNCFDGDERDAYHTLSDAIKALSDVPDTNVGDTISRQAAIEEFDGVKVDEENCTEYDIGYNDGIDLAVSKLSVLPSADVQPVQRGHWQEAKTRTYGIYECDVCKGWTYIPNKPRDYKFCPRCGARMDGEKNE